MESHLKCECQLIFASLAILKNHELTCPFIKSYNSNIIHIPSPALISHQIFNRSPAAIHTTMSQNLHQPIKLRKCIMDSNVISEANRSIYDNVCSNENCIVEYNLKCKKILRCSHECLGSNKEKCLDCLKSDCSEYINYFDQNTKSLCPICLTDTIQNYCILQLACKHYIHRKCLKKRLELKWTTEEINFNFMKCPVCNYPIEYKSIKNYIIDEDILKLIEESSKLFEKLKIITQLMDENDKEDIQMEKYSFYLCASCSNPFCSGMKECREELEIDEKPVRICPECFDYSKIKGITDCNIHGRKHIQYKCKFCCNLASHFCFGTTHFCEDCHMEQLKGIYLTTKRKEELPICNGINSCPLEIDHAPNGEEYGMYCLLCIR